MLCGFIWKFKIKTIKIKIKPVCKTNWSTLLRVCDALQPDSRELQLHRCLLSEKSRSTQQVQCGCSTTVAKSRGGAPRCSNRSFCQLQTDHSAIDWFRFNKKRKQNSTKKKLLWKITMRECEKMESERNSEWTSLRRNGACGAQRSAPWAAQCLAAWTDNLVVAECVHENVRPQTASRLSKQLLEQHRNTNQQQQHTRNSLQEHSPGPRMVKCHS